MASPSELAASLGAFPEYAPATLDAADLAYLDTLALPAELDAFYRSHAPAAVLGTSSLLLTLAEMREEHEQMEPGITIRNAGCCILATANGNPYFVVRNDDDYEIRLVDHDEVGDDSDREALIELSASAPVFTAFAEFLDAFAAQVLPSSPYAAGEVTALEAWRTARG